MGRSWPGRLVLLSALVSAILLIPWAVQAQSDPTAPSNLTAEIIEGEGISLSWDAPAEDAEAVTGYEILRRRPKQGEDTLLIHVADTGSTATSYTDGEAAEAGERYVYRVKALRGGEKSRQSNYVNVELPDDFTSPQQSDPADLAPANLTAERADGDGVVLAWDAPAEDAESVTGSRYCGPGARQS